MKIFFYLFFISILLCGCKKNNVRKTVVYKTNGDTLVFYGGRVFGDGNGSYSVRQMTLDN